MNILRREFLKGLAAIGASVPLLRSLGDFEGVAAATPLDELKKEALESPEDLSGDIRFLLNGREVGRPLSIEVQNHPGSYFPDGTFVQQLWEDSKHLDGFRVDLLGTEEDYTHLISHGQSGEIAQVEFRGFGVAYRGRAMLESIALTSGNESIFDASAPLTAQCEFIVRGPFITIVDGGIDK